MQQQNECKLFTLRILRGKIGLPDFGKLGIYIKLKSVFVKHFKNVLNSSLNN